MNAALTRRLAVLETRRGGGAPRYIVLWGDDAATADPGDSHVIHIAWVDPSGTAIIALPHNARDPLPGKMLDA